MRNRYPLVFVQGHAQPDPVSVAIARALGAMLGAVRRTIGRASWALYGHRDFQRAILAHNFESQGGRVDRHQVEQAERELERLEQNASTLRAAIHRHKSELRKLGHLV